MTIAKLAKELCKREGLKKQIDIAQMTELLGHVSDILYAEPLLNKMDILMMFYKNGKKRATKKGA